jgi:hypothetical protein
VWFGVLVALLQVAMKRRTVSSISLRRAVRDGVWLAYVEEYASAVVMAMREESGSTQEAAGVGSLVLLLLDGWCFL